MPTADELTALQQTLSSGIRQQDYQLGRMLTALTTYVSELNTGDSALTTRVTAAETAATALTAQVTTLETALTALTARVHTLDNL